MDFLFASNVQSAQESSHSSEQFGTAMITGWIDGLHSLGKFNSFLAHREVKVKTSGLLVPREIGDIDILMNFGDDVVLQDILPPSGYVIRQ